MPCINCTTNSELLMTKSQRKSNLVYNAQSANEMNIQFISLWRILIETLDNIYVYAV